MAKLCSLVVARRVRVVAGGGAHTGNLIGRHGRTNTHPVNDNADHGLVACDSLRHDMRIIGVVHRVAEKIPTSSVSIPQLFHVTDELCLELEATVIRTKSEQSSR